jgi:UDP-N-acetylmuramate--alanine ligase
VLCDDYAHHPTEIKATLSACRLYCDMVDIKDVIVIWQPHKYSRTVDNLSSFKQCFKGCAKLIILPVWSVNNDITKEEANIDFEKEFKQYNIFLANNVKAKDGSLEVFYKKQNLLCEIKKGFIVGVGAGDITYQLRN